MQHFLDEGRSQAFTAPLYQAAWDPNSYFIDKALTIRVQLFPQGLLENYAEHYLDF